MGPKERADAREEAPVSPFMTILAELDKVPEEMDTDRIDQQAGSVPDHAVSALPSYGQAMEAAWKKGQRNKARALRRRLIKAFALSAAGLVVAAATTFGAAGALRWNGFLRIFHLSEGTLTFQSPARENPSLGSPEGFPPPSGEAEDFQEKRVTIRSAEDLYTLSTPGDKAFRPLLEKYALSGGTLVEDSFSAMLHLSLKDGDGQNIFLQIVTYAASAVDSMSAGVTFEIDAGSERTVRLGTDTVMVSTNGVNHNVHWVLPLGYCHIFGKAGEEELLEIARLLIGAGLKPA